MNVLFGKIRLSAVVHYMHIAGSVRRLMKSVFDRNWTLSKINQNLKITGINDNILLSPFNLSPISRAGNSRDQNDAAIITPLANPRLASRKDRLKKF